MSKTIFLYSRAYTEFFENLKKQLNLYKFIKCVLDGIVSAPTGIWTPVLGSKGQDDWPDYTIGAVLLLFMLEADFYFPGDTLNIPLQGPGTWGSVSILY